jgi:uncharacterized membrane protein YqjE
MPTREGERGLGPATKQVAEHASTLARLELELATLELKGKVAKLGLGIGLVGAAAVLSLFAVGFGLAAVAAVLATTLSTWVALLIVFGGLLLLGALFGLAGLASIRKGTPPVPEQAIAEAKLTSEAIKNGR